MLWVKCCQIFIHSTLFFFAILNVSIATSLENKQTLNKFDNELLPEELATTLSHLSHFDISRKHTKQFAPHSFLNIDLNNTKTYLFTSREPIRRSNKSNTYQRFTLTVMTYNHSSSAKTAFTTLFTSSDPNIGLSYAWDYIVNVGTNVFWLNATCLLSNQNWQKLKTRLQQRILPENNEQQHEAFECYCGQRCRQNREK